MRRLLAITIASTMCLALTVSAAAATSYDQPLVVVNSTTLLDKGFSDLVVSTTTGRVLISGGQGSTTLTVAGLDGQVSGSIPGQAGAAGLTLSRDGGTAYAALDDAGAISVIDVATGTERARYVIGADTCPYDVALAGGKLWFSYGCYELQPAQLGSVDLADPAAPMTLGLGGYLTFRPRLESGSIDDHLLFAMVEGEFPNTLVSYDVSTGTPVRRTALEQVQSVSEFAVAPDGASIVVATPGEYQFTTRLARYSTADLTEQGRYVVQGSVVSLALDAAGRVATYSDNASLAVFAPAEYEPRWAVFQTFAQGLDPAHRGIGMGPEGRLFVATRYASNTISNLTAMEASPVSTTFSIRTPAVLAVRKPVTIAGALVTSDGSDTGVRTIHVTRYDRRGAVSLPDVRTAADGSFTVNDKPRATGATRWEFGFDATDRLLATTGTLSASVGR
jgi:hypothetical protein